MPGHLENWYFAEVWNLGDLGCLTAPFRNHLAPKLEGACIFRRYIYICSKKTSTPIKKTMLGRFVFAEVFFQRNPDTEKWRSR